MNKFILVALILLIVTGCGRGGRDKQAPPDLPRRSNLLFLRNLNDNTERCLTSSNFRGLDISTYWLAYQTNENNTEEIRVIKTGKLP